MMRLCATPSSSSFLWPSNLMTNNVTPYSGKLCQAWMNFNFDSISDRSLTLACASSMRFVACEWNQFIELVKPITRSLLEFVLRCLPFLSISCKCVAKGNRSVQSNRDLCLRLERAPVSACSKTILCSTLLNRTNYRPANVPLMLNDMRPSIWHIDPPVNEWIEWVDCMIVRYCSVIFRGTYGIAPNPHFTIRSDAIIRRNL